MKQTDKAIWITIGIGLSIVLVLGIYATLKYLVMI